MMSSISRSLRSQILKVYETSYNWDTRAGWATTRLQIPFIPDLIEHTENGPQFGEGLHAKSFLNWTEHRRKREKCKRESKERV